MSGQTVTRSTSTTSTNRRQPLIAVFATTRSTSTSSTNVREVAGGTTGNVCLLCCCCPCVLLEFLVLAVYKVPMNVVRRMWKSQRRKTLTKKRKKKKVILEEAMEVNVTNQQQRHCQHQPGQHVVGYIDELSDVEFKEFEKVKVSIDGLAEAVELDKQMWDRFRDAGFWRSPSQKFD
ncbi:uncharacterized protein LOC141589673 [Silene latifolia]|uniref:uncharacterized protein LOC141589673 n=1 Tax=Silene latifolia TaxID=37657 RepID=UPI003D77456B